MKRGNCIFHKESGTCNNTFTEEHIIQKSLGGSLSSKKITCANCNNYFSQDLDIQLTKLYFPIIYILSPVLPGKLKTKVQKIKTIDGLPIKLTAGGTATVDGIQTKYNDKGKWEETLAPESYSREEIVSISRHSGAKISETDFSRVPFSDYLDRSGYAICLKVNDVIIRAVCLDILEFIRYGTLNPDLNFPDITNKDILGEFRNFVRNGISSGFRAYYRYYAPINDLIDPLFEPSLFSHKLVVSYDYKSKCLILAAQFVDVMPWLVVFDNVNLHSSSISLLYKKDLVGGDDQIFVENKAVFDPKVIKWRTFSLTKRYSRNFAKLKFVESYRNQYGRAIYELDMRSDKEIHETLSNRVKKYRKSKSCPQVKAITEVIGIRYCGNRYLNDVKNEAYKMALSLWESSQTNKRKRRDKTLEIYRVCLENIAARYGMPKILSDYK